MKEEEEEKESASVSLDEEELEETKADKDTDEELEEQNEETKKNEDDDNESSEKRKKDKKGLSLGAKIAIVVVIVVALILILLKVFKKGEYTVKFDVDGGTKINEQIVKKNEKVKEPSEPTKDGYEFEGWYLNGKEYDFDSKVTSDLVIKAKWNSTNTAEVSGISIDQEEIGLRRGDETRLIVEVEPSDARNKNVTWKSSDESVVRIDEDGNVKAVSNGTAVITVTTEEGGFEAVCRVVVSDDIVKVTSLKLDKDEITVAVEDTVKVGATVEPSEATNKGLIWESEDEEIATVSSTGIIRGKKEGKTTIVVRTKDGNYREEIKVTVKKVEVENVIISGDSTLKVGGTTTLTAKITPSNAANKEVTWKSSDTAIATVDSNGKVTGKKEGNVTITVTTKEGDKKATHKMKIVKPVPVTGIELSKTSLELQVGESATLSVKVLPSNADNSKYTWKNSDSSVAKIEGGKVTAKKEGTTTITVTSDDGKFTATCKVTVKEKASTSSSNSDKNESNSNSSENEENKDSSENSESKENDEKTEE